jgi:hypothetical protein
MRSALFTDVAEEEIVKIISKKGFIKNAGTIKRAVNKVTFKGYTFSGVAFYLAKKKTYSSSMDIDKDVTLLYASVYFKSPHSGNCAALLVTCHSQDGKLWIRDEIIQSDGYFTRNPFGVIGAEYSYKPLKCYLASGEEVKSVYGIEFQY